MRRYWCRYGRKPHNLFYFWIVKAVSASHCFFSIREGCVRSHDSRRYAGYDWSARDWIGPVFFFLVEEAYYTPQGRAHSRRLHLDWATRPALMSRAAHAVESKAVVRIEVAVSPRPCLGCAVELVLRSLKLPVLIVIGEALCSVLTHLGCP
jgi:hypothetical protein